MKLSPFCLFYHIRLPNLLLFFCPFLIQFHSTAITAQQPAYIIKREKFRTPLSSIQISPDGSILLAGFQDGSFSLLDPGSFKPQLEVQEAHHKAVNAMEISPKRDFVLTAGNHSIFLWDLTGRKVASWPGHATTIWNVDISSNGKFAVSSAFNKTFLLWDVFNNKVLEKMQGHEDVTMSVCISPDDRWIASGSSDLTIKIWDVASKQVVKTFHGPTEDIYDVAFSPDNQWLAAASRDRTIRVYDLKEDRLRHLLKGHRDMVMEVAFSPDGNYILSGSADHSLILWDAVSGEQIHAFLDNEEAVLDLVFHPDGKSFFSISFAGDLTRWELHPEIFILWKFGDQYQEILQGDPLFMPRQKGESKQDFQQRQEQAALKKSDLIQSYYLKYLEQRKQ